MLVSPRRTGKAAGNGTQRAGFRDCSPERYDQLLADILDDPEAESVAPLLVRRRNRLQARSREQRLANQRHQTGGAQ
jgi:hypothetical protein